LLDLGGVGFQHPRVEKASLAQLAVGQLGLPGLVHASSSEACGEDLDGAQARRGIPVALIVPEARRGTVAIRVFAVSLCGRRLSSADGAVFIDVALTVSSEVSVVAHAVPEVARALTAADGAIRRNCATTGVANLELLEHRAQGLALRSQQHQDEGVLLARRQRIQVVDLDRAVHERRRARRRGGVRATSVGLAGCLGAPGHRVAFGSGSGVRHR